MTRECQQIRELLDSFLSSELTVETNHTVLRHLESCDDCRAEADRRRQTRQLLTASLTGDANALDVTELRRRIVDTIDADDKSTWRRAARYWPIAAMIALAVSASLWWTRPVDAAAYVDSADNHVACTGTLPPGVTFERDRIAQYLSGPFVSFVDSTAHKFGDVELVDAHLCPYKGRDYVHLVYRDRGHLVSLFAEPAARGALPSASHVDPLPQTDLSVRSMTLKGFEVDSVATRDHHLFIVSDEASVIPNDARDGILQSAARFVETLEERK